jgi:hypothetical protein
MIELKRRTEKDMIKCELDKLKDNIKSLLSLC